MSILLYAESEGEVVKKSALELACYAKALSEVMKCPVYALCINTKDSSILSKYGISKVYTINDPKMASFDAKAYAKIIAHAAHKLESTVILVSSSINSRYLAPLLSGYLSASYASNVSRLPESVSPFVVRRSVFSNKAFSDTVLASDIKIIGLLSNSFGVSESPVEHKVEKLDIDLSNIDFSGKIIQTEKSTGKLSIADASIVVSGGRGLKGPENWSLIEDLAEVLNAATACSKPVSDMGWRPHSEHVGQTGKQVAANVYIAIGISGAIQHIAGINTSKLKIVINNDPEAPFFKYADYGVVADAFEVLPLITQKLKKR